MPEPLMSHLFDMFFWMARVGMCLHTLVFGCLWFAFCRSNDMKGKGEMGTGKPEACATKEQVVMP